MDSALEETAMLRGSR